MYHHILVPLENDWADASIISHIRELATLTGAKITLVHVADGWAARNFHRLGLQESEEMQSDRDYLNQRTEEFRTDGFVCDSILMVGEPADEIIKLVAESDMDLVAMATHGHRMLGDLFFGSTSRKVRHRVKVPVLLLLAERRPKV
jgi:nucleotide-binding universal stress UspA family protein